MSAELTSTDVFINFRYPSEAEAEKTFICEKFQAVKEKAQTDPYVEKSCDACPLTIEFVPNLEQSFIEGICQDSNT